MRVILPPPLILALAVFVMWLINKLEFPPRLTFAYQNSVVIALVLLGIAIMVTAIVSFQRAKTTVDPLRPGKASTIVDSGVFRYTRNPMYLAMLIFLIAFVVKLGNALGLLVIAAFAIYMTAVQIASEERALTDKFGAEYEAYKAKVRRWF